MKKRTVLVLSLVVLSIFGGCNGAPDRTVDVSDGTVDAPELDKVETVSSDQVRWEYTPVLSSRYPAMAFSFKVSHQKIEASCDNGTLIDYDHFNSAQKGYPEGKSLTVQEAGSLYWAPWDGEENDAASAEVTVTVLGGGDQVLYEGTLSIVREEETESGAIYSAAWEGSPELTLGQDEYQLGGVLTRSSMGITLSAKDVTPAGMTLVIAQCGGYSAGELLYGSEYTLEVWNDGVWEAAPYVTENIAWTLEAYPVKMNGEVEKDIAWEYVYGRLPAGTYRLSKDIMDFRGTGEYDMQTCFVEFEIS